MINQGDIKEQRKRLEKAESMLNWIDLLIEYKRPGSQIQDKIDEYNDFLEASTIGAVNPF